MHPWLRRPRRNRPPSTGATRRGAPRRRPGGLPRARRPAVPAPRAAACGAGVPAGPGARPGAQDNRAAGPCGGGRQRAGAAAVHRADGQSPWDAAAVLQAHQAYVGETRGDAEEGAFIFDGCDVPKQGTASVGVARQWRHRGGQRRGRPGSRRGAGPGRLASSRHPERPRAALSGPGPPAARGGTRP